MLTIQRNGRSDSAILESFFVLAGWTASDYGALIFRPVSHNFTTLVELDFEPAAMHSEPGRKSEVVTCERKLLCILG